MMITDAYDNIVDPTGMTTIEYTPKKITVDFVPMEIPYTSGFPDR